MSHEHQVLTYSLEKKARRILFFLAFDRLSDLYAGIIIKPARGRGFSWPGQNKTELENIFNFVSFFYLWRLFSDFEQM